MPVDLCFISMLRSPYIYMSELVPRYIGPYTKAEARDSFRIYNIIFGPLQIFIIHGPVQSLTLHTLKAAGQTCKPTPHACPPHLTPSLAPAP